MSDGKWEGGDAGHDFVGEVFVEVFGGEVGEGRGGQPCCREGWGPTAGKTGRGRKPWFGGTKLQ